MKTLISAAKHILNAMAFSNADNYSEFYANLRKLDAAEGVTKAAVSSQHHAGGSDVLPAHAVPAQHAF